MSTSPGRGQDGRAVLLEAARRVFSDRGYDGASIRDIAQEAGLSLSALYYYFPSKQDALLELVCSTFDEFLAGAAEILRHSGDAPRDRLADLVAFIVDFRIRSREGSRVVLHETERLEPARFEIARQRQIASNDLIRSVIQHGVDTGDFATPTPDEAVRAITALCNSLPLWYREDGELSPETIRRRYVRFAFLLVESEPPAVVEAEPTEAEPPTVAPDAATPVTGGG